MNDNESIHTAIAMWHAVRLNDPNAAVNVAKLLFRTDNATPLEMTQAALAGMTELVGHLAAKLAEYALDMPFSVEGAAEVLRHMSEQLDAEDAA